MNVICDTQKRSAFDFRRFAQKPKKGKFASWPVSRVLYGPGFPERGSHSSGTAFARCLAQPTRMTGPETGCSNACAPPASSLFGLAPGGVCRAVPIAGGAVRSCRTISPLRQAEARFRGIISVALSLGSPPPGVTRHRVSMEPGLSSPAPFRALRQRSSSQLAGGEVGDWDGNSNRHGLRPRTPPARRTPSCAA